MQIFYLFTKKKHLNELCFHTPGLERKTHKKKLQLLKILYSASSNVSVLSDKGLVYSSLQYQHNRVASFSREIFCQASQAFDLNLVVHSGTSLICFELLELIKRKKQVFFKILLCTILLYKQKGGKKPGFSNITVSFICQILNSYYNML